MPNTSPIQCFRETLAAVERGVPTSPEAAAWFVAWGRTWLARAEARRPISMEAAAGLGAPGRPNWTKLEQRRERDAAFRELHRQHFPELAPRAAARAILAIEPRPFPMDINERQLANVLGK